MEAVVYRCEAYASFFQRLAANAIDGLLIGILNILAFPIAMLLSVSPEVLQALVSILYIIGYKAARAESIGYRMAKITIVALDGSRPRFWQMVVREICAIVSAIALFIGFIAMLSSPNRQTWHDRLAGTYVIKRGSQPAEQVRLERDSMVNTRGAVSLIAISTLIAIGFLSLVWHVVENNPACIASKEFVKKNPRVLAALGSQPRKLGCLEFRVTTHGDTGEAQVVLRAEGDDGEAIVRTELTRKGEAWEIVRAGIVKGDKIEQVDVTERNPEP